MINKTKNNSAFAAKMWAVAPLFAIMLTSPTVRLVDLLPDFIPCLALAVMLQYAADRAPFFAEAREGFIRLGLVSLLKIPAFVIENTARAGNVSNFDITVLFTFSFSVLEGILLIGIVRDLFAGLFYLGERSGLRALIVPFPISKKNAARLMTPESLRALCGFAVIFRLCACFLPELLLLSKTTDSGAYILNLKVYYPYAVVLAVIASTVVWIITSRRLCAYIRAIRAEGGFNESLDSLIHPQGEEDFRRKIFARRSDFSFKLLTLAAALMLCLRVESLGGVNLIPSFAVGIAFGIVGIRLLGRSTLGISTLVVGIIHSATMLAASIAEFVFLNEHSLSELSKNESLVKEYIPTVVLNAVAIVPFALLLVLMAAAVCTYHRDAVMSECKQSLSTRAVTDKARAFASKFVIWTILGLAVAISRAVDLFFNLNTDVIYVTVENYWGEVLPGSVTLSSVPWFGTVVFIITAIFVGYTAYLGSVMKDEVELYLG